MISSALAPSASIQGFRAHPEDRLQLVGAETGVEQMPRFVVDGDAPCRRSFRGGSESRSRSSDP